MAHITRTSMKAKTDHPPSRGACLSSYAHLLAASEKLAEQLIPALPASRGADGPRIGVYAEPGAGYVAATWASWMAGGIAVPLAVSHPPQELQYVLEDAGVSRVRQQQQQQRRRRRRDLSKLLARDCRGGFSVKPTCCPCRHIAVQVLAPSSSHQKLHAACQAAGATLQELPPELLQPQLGSQDNAGSSSRSGSERDSQSMHEQQLPGVSSRSGSSSAGALIVYTSGTTGRPKGALHTHGWVGTSHPDSMCLYYQPLASRDVSMGCLPRSRRPSLYSVRKGCMPL